MFRIAVWYESSLGRNDGNPLYVCTALKRAQMFCDIKIGRNQNGKLLSAFPGGKIADPMAEKIADWVLQNLDPEGLEVMHVRPYGDLKPYGTFDLNIWVDWGEDALRGILPYEPLYPPAKPLAYWASDTHLGYDHRLACSKQADLVFVAQERARKEFAKDGVEAVWLPHAVEPLAYPKQNHASKKFDICFIGHVNAQNRIDALDRVFSNFPHFFYGQRRFEEAADIYGQSKICFNQAMVDDINMRCFEVLGAGGFLLTDDLPTMEALGLKHGVHCALYTGLDDMVMKAQYYLKHEKERESIAEAGHAFVMQNHTIGHRVLTMLKTYKKSLIKETV